jgi:hypothetical protein
MTPEQKKQIDAMTQIQMAKRWRFAVVGDPLLQGDTGDYFAKVFNEKGGMTPGISKMIGWDA